MYKRVLVPLDGSPVAEAVLPFVIEIAGPLDLEVVLLRVVPPMSAEVVEGAWAATQDLETRRIDAEEYLAPLAVELRARGLRVQARVQPGHPVEEIIAAARQTGADLVAMSTHGRSGLGRLVFGSVAEAVVRHAELPVLLMRVTQAEVARQEARRAERTGAAPSRRPA